MTSRYSSATAALAEKPAKPVKPKKKPEKIDPNFLAANRELRDRYLEQLNTFDVAGCGKYDVSRMLPAPRATPLLDAA